MSAYFRPETLAGALQALDERPHLVLAGGTDVYPADASARGWGGAGIAHPNGAPILDISAVPDLSRIERTGDRVEIGALVTWTGAIGCDLPAWFDGVRLAAREVGGRQIQNRGTLAGNLCNASPAADGVPALLALDARVRLERLGARRELALADFLLGNRSTALAPDELLTAIVVPVPGAGARATFLKLGARRYLVISIAMVSACVELNDGRIADARIAVGACSASAVRLARLEHRLLGKSGSLAAGEVSEADLADLAPIDDVRASAPYRLHAARVLVRRALETLCGGGER